MASRRTSFQLGIAIAFASGCGGSIAMSACSSSSEEINGAPAGLSDAARDAVVVDAETRDPDAAPEETTTDCVAKCKTAHPNAVAKYDAIDTCWDQSCKGPCIDQTGAFDAGGDAGEGGTFNDGGTNLCGTPVSSASDRACDDCTEALCCPAWKGCYDDADCLEYNRCVNKCP